MSHSVAPDSSPHSSDMPIVERECPIAAVSREIAEIAEATPEQCKELLATIQDPLEVAYNREFHQNIREKLHDIGGKACISDLTNQFRGFHPDELKAALSVMVHYGLLTMEPNSTNNPLLTRYCFVGHLSKDQLAQYFEALGNKSE